MNLEAFRNLKEKVIVIGGDHHAQPIARIIHKHLKDKGLNTEFVKYSEEFYDYIHQATSVSRIVSSFPDKFCGIVGCKNGFGVTTLCNKYPNVFAARCDTPEEAVNSRKVNYSNVLTFGSDFVDEQSIKEIVDKWLETEFDLNEKNISRLKRLYDIGQEIHSKTFMPGSRI